MIAIFGGTFDPITLGHIHVAKQVQILLDPDSIHFLPCAVPVHRAQPVASPIQRCDMIELATQSIDGVSLDRSEIDRGGDSFMVDTLENLKEINSGETLLLVIGSDVYEDFNRWKSPRKILEYCHLIVCRRPNHEAECSEFYNYQTIELKQIQHSPAGSILILDIQPNECSSTYVRSQLMQKKTVSNCISPPVLDYIIANQIYSQISEI
jgi:nicotinate-nucleotide adenylyltransferase